MLVDVDAPTCGSDRSCPSRKVTGATPGSVARESASGKCFRSFLSLGRTGTVNKDVSKIIILPIDSQRCGVKDMTSGGVFSPDTENFQKDFLDFLVLGMSARGTFSDRSILCAQSPLATEPGSAPVTLREGQQRLLPQMGVSTSKSASIVLQLA